MSLLGARLYDPAVAVTKDTSALLAMTALDTTNLRLTVTVPSHGMLRVCLKGRVHGATTFPAILLGVLSGSTVMGRISPRQYLGSTAVATSLVGVVADFIIPNLTPGPITLDAAYGVETLVAATALKYGGPNDTTANNAFGAFMFEIYDPVSVPQTGDTYARVGAPIGASMSADVAAVKADAVLIKTVTNALPNAGALTNLDAAISTRATPTNITAGVITTVTNLTNAPTNGDLTATMKTSVTDAATAATPAVSVDTAAIWDRPTSALTVAGSVGKRVVDNVDAQISSRATPTNITAGTITTVTNLTNAPTSGDFTMTMKDSATIIANDAALGVTVSGEVNISSAAVLAVFNQPVSTITVPGSIGAMLQRVYVK